MTEKELQELILKFIEQEYLSQLKKKELLIKKALHIDFNIWMKKDYPSHIIKAEIQAKYIKPILDYFKQEITPRYFISFVKSQQAKEESIKEDLIAGIYLNQENGIQKHIAMSDLVGGFCYTLNQMIGHGTLTIQGLMSQDEFMEYYNKFMETNEETK